MNSIILCCQVYNYLLISLDSFGQKALQLAGWVCILFFSAFGSAAQSAALEEK